MPSYGDLQLDLQAADTPFANFDVLKEALENYDESLAIAAFAKLKDLLMQWNWKLKALPQLGREPLAMLVAALAAATFIQSTFKFRPQVCIVGISGSGKSSLMDDLLTVLYGKLATRKDQVTAAAIEQNAANNSTMLLFDEMETSIERPKILRRMRSSSGGTPSSKGTPNRKAHDFSLRHIIWLSSIEMNLSNQADASRFFQFEPQQPEQQEGTRTTLQLDKQTIAKIGFDLMIFAIKNMQMLLDTVRTLSEVYIKNAMPRNITLVSVPAAFAEKLNGWSREETLCYMDCWINSNCAQKITDVVNDHEHLLQDILVTIIQRITNWTDLSVEQALQKYYENRHTHPADAKLLKEALARNGIQIVKPPTEDYIVYFIPKILCTTLLKNTKWQYADLGQLLERIDAAKEKTVQHGGITKRGIGILLKNLINTEHSEDDSAEQTF